MKEWKKCVVQRRKPERGQENMGSGLGSGPEADGGKMARELGVKFTLRFWGNVGLCRWEINYNVMSGDYGRNYILFIIYIMWYENSRKMQGVIAVTGPSRQQRRPSRQIPCTAVVTIAEGSLPSAVGHRSPVDWTTPKVHQMSETYVKQDININEGL